MRISDWSSDVCSSDLGLGVALHLGQQGRGVVLRQVAELELAAAVARPDVELGAALAGAGVDGGVGHVESGVEGALGGIARRYFCELDDPPRGRVHRFTLGRASVAVRGVQYVLYAGLGE